MVLYLLGRFPLLRKATWRAGTVWYHPSDIANILSLNNFQKGYKVTYNSTMKAGFVIHRADGTNHVFQHFEKGLFISDVKCDLALISTVDSNWNTQVKRTPTAVNSSLYKIS